MPNGHHQQLCGIRLAVICQQSGLLHIVEAALLFQPVPMVSRGIRQMNRVVYLQLMLNYLAAQQASRHHQKET